MTVQRPISSPVSAQDAATWAACQRALGAALTAAQSVPEGRRMLGEALSGMMEIVGAGSPPLDGFAGVRDDARFWADIATPVELEAYVGAGLRRIERATFAEQARKRIFMALWRSFTARQQADFIKAMTAKEG